MKNSSINTITNALYERLFGTAVTLSPIQIEHAIGLFDAANNEKIWPLLPHPPFKSVTEVKEWIASTIEAKDELAFCIFNTEEEIIGSTRYLDIQKKLSKN